MCSSLLGDELYSLSFDSLPDCESSNIPWYGLVRNLSYSKFEILKEQFKKECNEDEEGKVDEEQFEKMIRDIFGNNKYSLHSKLLYEDIVKHTGKLLITWNDYLDYLIETLNPKIDQKVTFCLNKVEDVSYAKRESVVKILLIEADKYFCYAIITKHGRVGLYDGNLNFLTSYHALMTREDITRSEDDRRRRNRCVTDAVYCRDIQMFIITNSARTLVIYEASGMKHVPYWLIVGLPEIAQCLSYKRAPKYKRKDDFHKRNDRSCILFLGCFNGNLMFFKFLQPNAALLRRKHMDKITLFYWHELASEKEYLEVKIFANIHSNTVNQMEYDIGDDSITTCSNDSTNSVVKKFLSHLRESHIYKIAKGCSSFASNHVLKLLVTGSIDGKIRLWNSLIVSSAIAVIEGHKTRIVDLQIMTNQDILLSVSEDGLLKVWDVIEQMCFQTLKIKFPSLKIAGKTIEFGNQSIYPGPKRIPHTWVDRPPVNKNCFSISDIIPATENNDESERPYLDIWDRSNIIVTCCEHLALITLTFKNMDIERTFEMQVLPPPPLQNSVLIPSNWRIQDVNPQKQENIQDEGDIEKALNKLEFILNKDLLDCVGAKSDINHKIAILETKKVEMQSHVAKGGPYLALDLCNIEEMRLSNDLPIPNKKKARALAEKTKKILSEASRKDEAFLENSSSRSTSSRCSIVEFPY